MSERVLTLRLRGLYFRQIRSGMKAFEYRLDTPYWRKRIFERPYDRIVLTLGYPKADDESRHLSRPYRGYEMQTITHPHFGDEPVNVFAILVNED